MNTAEDDESLLKTGPKLRAPTDQAQMARNFDRKTNVFKSSITSLLRPRITEHRTFFQGCRKIADFLIQISQQVLIRLLQVSAAFLAFYIVFKICYFQAFKCELLH